MRYSYVGCRLRGTLVTLSAVLLLGGLAACDEDNTSAEADTESTDSLGAGGTATLTFPLTGEPLDGRSPDHPVMMVKIDNTASAAPQVGLSDADLVIEELVEGGLTRLAALYHSELAPVVGPVRSVRTSDIGLAAPTRGVLVASGGGQPTLGRLERAGITTGFPGQVPGFFRASDRTAPYDLMLHLRQAADASDAADDVPEYLPWAAEAAPLDGEHVTRLSATFSTSSRSEWAYNPDSGWTMTNGQQASGDEFEADNLLVIMVRIHQASYVDPSGAPVPETILTGSGKAVLVHADQAVTGEWTKPSDEVPLQLVDDSGDPLLVPPGNTWIELVPTTGSVKLGN